MTTMTTIGSEQQKAYLVIDNRSICIFIKRQSKHIPITIKVVRYQHNLEVMMLTFLLPGNNIMLRLDFQVIPTSRIVWKIQNKCMILTSEKFLYHMIQTTILSQIIRNRYLLKINSNVSLYLMVTLRKFYNHNESCHFPKKKGF